MSGAVLTEAVLRAVVLVDRAMRRNYGKGLDEMEIAESKGYWKDREAQTHPGHPLHRCLFCDGPFKATYSFFDHSRDEKGRFLSPTRAWKVIKEATQRAKESVD